MPASRPAPPTPGALRRGLAVLGAIGALCLIASTFATIIRIEVGTTSKVPDFDTHLSGWDRHGPALLLLGAVRAGRWSRARCAARAPAAAALAAVGVVALLLVVLVDVPDLNKVGFIGKLYEDAVAGPRIGFFLESAGAAMLLAAGGLLLFAGPAERGAREPATAGGANAPPERLGPTRAAACERQRIPATNQALCAQIRAYQR